MTLIKVKRKSLVVTVALLVAAASLLAGCGQDETLSNQVKPQPSRFQKPTTGGAPAGMDTKNAPAGQPAAGK